MSVEAENWAWKQTTKANKLVLVALANRADEKGVCWPGIKGIAERCQLSERSVRYSLKALESENLIQRVHSFDEKTKRQTSNTYALRVQDLQGEGEVGFRGEGADFAGGRVQPASPLELSYINSIRKNNHAKRPPIVPLNAGGQRRTAQQPAAEETDWERYIKKVQRRGESAKF